MTYYGHFDFGENLFFVVEYIKGDTLLTWRKNNKNPTELELRGMILYVYLTKDFKVEY